MNPSQGNLGWVLFCAELVSLVAAHHVRFAARLPRAAHTSTDPIFPNIFVPVSRRCYLNPLNGPSWTPSRSRAAAHGAPRLHLRDHLRAGPRLPGGGGHFPGCERRGVPELWRV